MSVSAKSDNSQQVTGLSEAGAQNQLAKGPLVSVVIPLYNAEEFVCEAVQSVLDQTYRNIEVIIVDDCSTDDSYTRVCKFSEDPRVTVLRSKQNQGVAESRNIGIQNCRGDYVCFLDSDDYWVKDKVEQQLKHLSRSGADVCCTAYRHVGKAGNVLRKVVPPRDNISYDKLLNQNVIGCSTVMAKKEAIQEGRFKKVGHEDFCFWLDLLKEQRIRVVGIQEPLVDYRVLDSSLSRNKLRAAVWTWRVYRRSQNLTLPQASYHFCHYAVRSLKKYLNLNRLGSKAA